MIHQAFSQEELRQLENKIKEERPLIHCLTNAISINDCANVVLALGAQPIMAEHPMETAQITKTASALALNLGNITDSRMKAMLISAETAKACKIPMVIDLVGTGCSTLRRNYAKELITNYQPQVIKGNMSELKAMSSKVSHAKGIDVGVKDCVTEGNLKESVRFLQELAAFYGSVVVATGKIDLISDGKISYVVRNGVPELAQITGTGCMLNVMIATYLAAGKSMQAALLAVLVMNLAGEKAAALSKGPGSFHIQLLDTLAQYHDLEGSHYEIMMNQRG